MVEGVIAGLVVVRSVGDVDHVEGGYAALDERKMIIFFGALRLEDVGRVVGVDGGLSHQVAQVLV